MNQSEPASVRSAEFISRPEHYYPRLRRSLLLLLIGAVLAFLGYYLISNDLPDFSVRRVQVSAQWIPLAAGLFSLAFGVIGLVTALTGIQRKGREAIDLVVSRDGIVVRGERHIAWKSIKSVTSVEYQNESKVKLLWNAEELQRSLLVTIANDVELPGKKSKLGEPYVKINLLRYPADEYLKHYKQIMNQFARHNIVVKQQKKWKQT